MKHYLVTVGLVFTPYLSKTLWFRTTGICLELPDDRSSGLPAVGFQSPASCSQCAVPKCEVKAGLYLGATLCLFKTKLTPNIIYI